MADDIDRAGENQAIFDKYLLQGRVRKPELPAATGKCFLCQEPVLTAKRFCDEDCQNRYEREQKVRGR